MHTERGDRNPNKEDRFLLLCPWCGVGWWYLPGDPENDGSMVKKGRLTCCGQDWIPQQIHDDPSVAYWKRMIVDGYTQGRAGVNPHLEPVDASPPAS